MGKGKGSNRAFNNFKKANIDHFAHQVNVTGVGAHRDVKKYTRKFNQKKVEEAIEDAMRENTLQERADHIPNEEESSDDDE
jgi:hypothetical protein